MWCYQKPGFEALLLSELQKQQQCRQFCDTLLKAGGVSVPTHSCVLSAISPHLSSALSSTPPPPGGQRHFLEFQTLSACTLLHMVRLLYSGEMAGEGEKEKQEALSAAAKLGIHGLVEVTKRNHNSRNKVDEDQHVEVGVQTKTLMPQESEGKLERWRRVVRDGSTILWKEKLSDGENDKCVQTEEVPVNAASPYHQTAYSTIDMTALLGLGQTDSHLVPPQMPYIPMPLIYPTDQSDVPHHASASAASMQDSTAAGHTSVAVVAQPPSSVPSSFLPFSTQPTHFVADPQTWWTGPEGADRGDVADEEQEDERLAHFQGNIPGFINYFLSPNMEEGSRRGRAGRRRRAEVGVARRAGRGERRGRRPRARTGGSGRGGLMQTVDVQDVGVSRLQKQFLQREGVRASRLGQGGGAVGRKLYLKTREVFKALKTSQRRRRGKKWEFSQSGDELPFNEKGRRGGNKIRGRKGKVQQLQQDIPTVGRPRRTRAKPPTSLFSSSPPVQFFKANNFSASNLSLQPSPCPSLLSPAVSNKSPASSLLFTPSLPPAAPPPNEDQPDHIERLLEEVMMGLANNEVPCLQHQGEGEPNKLLDQFLQMCEQQLERCSAVEEQVMGGHSSTKSDEAATQQSCLQPQKAGDHPAVQPEVPEGGSRKARTPTRQSTKRERKPTDQKSRIYSDGELKQLQQRPVVKLVRRSLLPVRVKLQGSCQDATVKTPEKTKTSSSLMNYPCDNLSDKNQPAHWDTRTYPLKSMFEQVHITDSFCEETRQSKRPQGGRRRGRPRKNCQLANNSESSTSQIQPQPVEPCGTEEQLESNYERPKEKLIVQPQEATEGSTWTGKRRRSYSVKDTTSDAAEVKRVYFGQVSQLTTLTHITRSKSADCVSGAATVDAEDAIIVETVSLTIAGDGRQSKEDSDRLVRNDVTIEETMGFLMNDEMKGGSDVILDVDSNLHVITDLDKISDNCREEEEKSCCQFGAPAVSPHSHSAKGASLGSTGTEEDDDIDVTGGSCPPPDPVIISWKTSSEGEEEDGGGDIDVIG